MLNLKGLRILLIRPQALGESEPDSFSQFLSEEGVEFNHYPVMKLSPLDSVESLESIKAHILNFSDYDKSIFISRTAAKLALEWLGQYCAMVPEALPIGMEYYAVGKGTASVLQQHHMTVSVPDETADSEGLLALPSLNVVDGEKIIIFCGKGGRLVLTEELRQRGATVSRCELYRREPLDTYATQINQLLSEAAPELIVVHSGELLDLLVDLVEPDQQLALYHCPLLVPSDRVRQRAIGMGFSQVVCSESALLEDMASSLRGWYSTKIG